MWKIILVEDEVYVRESIKDLVAWEDHGFQIVGEAGNGREALVLIADKSPDVVLTDIMMPVMDGIELLKNSKGEGHTPKFIMLTCMSDFHLAQEALKYGASDYILKLSMSDELLMVSLEKVKSELLQQLREPSGSLYPLYQHLWELILSDSLGEQPSFPRHMPEISRYKQMYVTLVSVLHGSDPVGLKELEQSHIIREHEYSIIHPFTQMGHTTFFCWSAKANFSTFGSRKGIYKGSTVSVDRILEEWRNALLNLDQYWYGQRVDKDQAGHQSFAGIQQTFWESERELIGEFEGMRVEHCRHSIERIWGEMEERRLTMVRVKQKALQLDGLFSRMSSSAGMDGNEFVEARSHEELKNLLMRRMELGLEKKKDESVLHSGHPEVDKAISLIMEHYDRPLQVKDMAKHVLMNEDYLSALFKKKTGETPIGFLQRTRVEKAKQLLVQSKLSLGEIAGKTGFTDNAYFIKIFKRMTKITPSAYRKKQENGPNFQAPV